MSTSYWKTDMTSTPTKYRVTEERLVIKNSKIDDIIIFIDEITQ